MKALILGAGFGTRLERDLNADSSGKYGHLRGIPKALLPVDGKPLIEYWVEMFRKVPTIEHIYTVCNAVGYSQFCSWAHRYGFPLECIINNGRRTNESRKGAVADIAAVVKEKNIEDHLLVVAGDTLCLPDFNLNDLLHYFHLKKGVVVTQYAVRDQDVSNRGIIEVDDNDKVTSFLEKPALEETSSRRACPPIYIYDKATLPLFDNFIAQESMLGINYVDAPGKFIAWVYTKVPAYARPISGRFDIGSLNEYISANSFFERQSP